MSYAVHPVNDLIEHDVHSEDCVCGPELVREPTDRGDEWIIVHHALDGRQ